MEHIQEAKYLSFGKIKVDVSNVSHDRLMKARKMWNKSFQVGKETKKKLNADYYNRKANEIGSYLIRQDFSVLLRRFTFTEAVREYVKRLLLTARFINKSLKSEYDAFHNWISLQITGKSLDDLKKKNEMEELTMKMHEKITEMGIKPEQCLELLTTFLQEQGGSLNMSKAGQQT